MIVGIGVDIVKVARIRRAIENGGEMFISRVFTETEQKYCQQRWPYQHYATRFAAKEAILKSFGFGWNMASWKEMEIVNNSKGAPIVLLHGKMAALKTEKGITEVLLSLSRCKTHAIAFAILQTNDNSSI